MKTRRTYRNESAMADQITQAQEDIKAQAETAEDFDSYYREALTRVQALAEGRWLVVGALQPDMYFKFTRGLRAKSKRMKVPVDIRRQYRTDHRINVLIRIKKKRGAAHDHIGAGGQSD